MRSRPLTWKFTSLILCPPQIFDVIAIRVVVSGNKHECYVAQRVVQELYRTMPERSKDFIRVVKKANGYQSLHETVLAEQGLPVEIQIRTSKMHYIAEYGFAAHWKYKESGGSSGGSAEESDSWLDREVQYKKWLMSYGLGVHDKKVRPVGSPPTDSSLKSLGAAFLDPSRRKGCGSDSSSAPAPLQSHPAGKVDPFLQHDRFRLEQPAPRPIVTVVLQTQDSGAEPRELPAGKSMQQLASDLGVSSLPGYVMTVNQRIVVPASSSSMAALKDGDLVQVLPLAQVLARSSNGGGIASAIVSPARLPPRSVTSTSPPLGQKSNIVLAPVALRRPLQLQPTAMATKLQLAGRALVSEDGKMATALREADEQLDIFGLHLSGPVSLTLGGAAGKVSSPAGIIPSISPVPMCGA